MKKVIITSALLSGFVAFSQQKPKQDSIRTTKIERVTVTKKVFQKKSDRMIFDVAASPSTKGNSAFELLKETPTVTTTDDKEFKILGKSAVAVFINGRKSNMNADALLSFLKTTPSENISKIEVISVPGSEFDVPGNTGIINIIMKKKLENGYNGTLKMENSKSYYDNPSSNINLNFRKNKLGGNVNLGYGEWAYHQNITIKNGNSTNKTTSEGEIIGRSKDLNFNTNLDYDLSEKSYLSWNLNTSFDNSNGGEQTFINKNYLNDVLQNSSLMRGYRKENSQNISTGLNYDYNLDDKGSKLKLNLAYLFFNKEQTDENRSFTYPELALVSGFNQNTPQKINNISFQGDYIKKFKNESTFSFGGNFSNTKTDNNTEYFGGNGIVFTKNDDLSNHFIYHENIAALYSNYEKMLGKKVSVKAGLRYEYTWTKGDVDGKSDAFYHFKKNYGNILPFLNLNYAVNENHNLSYSFSSRVRRPSFWELNPVRLYTTPTNYIQNNPFMMPSKNYDQELMYMYKNSYFITISDNYVKDASTQIPLQKVNNNGDVELRYIRTNYGNQNSISATLGFQKSFYKGAWIANYSVTGVYNKYTGSLDTDPLTNEKFDPYIVSRDSKYLVFSTNNNVALDKKKTYWFGMNYFIVTPQEIELGKLPTIQSLNLSLKKNWDNWTFMAKVDDVFNTQGKITIKSMQSSGYFSNVEQNNYNRSYSLSITYNFGNQKIKGARQEESANKDIKSRTGK